MAGFMLLAQVLAFLGIMLFVDVQGSCFVGQLMAEMTVSGRFRYYCEYTQAGHVIRLLPGSNMALLDECMECKCTLDGLECCGIGHASGAIGHPPDCKILLDGCQPLLVKVYDESLDCYSGSEINMTAMSTNVPHPDNVYMAHRTPETQNVINMTSPTTSSPETSQTTSSPNSSLKTSSVTSSTNSSQSTSPNITLLMTSPTTVSSDTSTTTPSTIVQTTPPTRPSMTKMPPNERTTIALKDRVMSAMSLIDLFQNLMKPQQRMLPNRNNFLSDIPALPHTIAPQRPMSVQEPLPYGFGHFDPQDVFLPWYFL